MTLPTIVLTGPECSGKTTLARELSYRYKTVWIPEYARFYLNRMERPEDYTLDDLEEMVIGTATWHAQAVENARKLLIQDTGRVVMSIWGEERFGQRPKNLDKLPLADLFLLCKPDVPYEEDPLRVNKSDRERLFALYESTLQKEELPYAVIEGTIPERLAQAEKAINNMRSKRR